MAEHAHITAGRPMPPPDLVDLNAHPDGADDELERVAAALPARTPFGRKMKEMAL